MYYQLWNWKYLSFLSFSCLTCSAWIHYTACSNDVPFIQDMPANWVSVLSTSQPTGRLNPSGGLLHPADSLLLEVLGVSTLHSSCCEHPLPRPGGAHFWAQGYLRAAAQWAERFSRWGEPHFSRCCWAHWNNSKCGYDSGRLTFGTQQSGGMHF